MLQSVGSSIQKNVCQIRRDLDPAMPHNNCKDQ